MPLLGLTGGVATGKTLVTDYLETKGIPVVDADRLAHALVRRDEPAYREIVRNFGPEILRPDRSLDRKKLGDLVFRDSKRRRELEAILHPRVYAAAWNEIRRIRGGDPDVLIVFSVPLLFETGVEREMDGVVVVYADEATQRKRLIDRDRLPPEDVQARIDAQMPIDAKKRAADYVIDNRGTVEETCRQVDELLARLESRG